MINHKDEHVIYIKDLLFAVLYKWRTVLIVTLALALLLGGYRLLSLQRNDADNEAAQELQENYAQQKNALETEIARLNAQIEFSSNYIATAPSMTIDPHNVYVTELHFYLQPLYTEPASAEKNFDPADALMGAYRKLLVRSESLTAIAEALGMEGMSMEGIVDVNCDQTTNLLTVIVRQAEQDDAVAIPDIIQAAIDNAKSTVEEIVGAHKVTMLSCSSFIRNDTDLAQYQAGMMSDLLNLEVTLKSRTAERDALVSPPAVQPTSGTQAFVSAIKYAILGGLLGCFCVAFLAVLFHLARKKVYSCRTLQDQTGLQILGCIPSNKKRSKIDLSLRKLEGRCMESPEHQSALIAARIRNICGIEGALLLSGAASADDCLPVLNALENAGYTVIANGNLLCNPETVSALGSCTGVVLLEQCGKSLYSSVYEAAEQAKAMGKPVLGCVLIDG